MELSYFRCDWLHPLNDDPTIIFYEVDREGRVPRMVEVFEGGRRACKLTVDFAGRENEMPGVDSLVEGDFREGIREMLEGPGMEADTDRATLSLSDRETFEAEWDAYR